MASVSWSAVKSEVTRPLKAGVGGTKITVVRGKRRQRKKQKGEKVHWHSHGRVGIEFELAVRTVR